MLSLLENFLFSDLKPLSNIINSNARKALERLGIITVRDLLFYRPTYYQTKIISPDLLKLQHGQLIQAEVTIKEIAFPVKKYHPLKILAENETGTILLVFFNKLPAFILNKLKIGTKHIISGKVQFFDYYFQISHPEFILNNKFLMPIEPIYPLTYGIINKQLYTCILNAIELLELKYKEIELKLDMIIKDYISSLLAELKIMHLYKTTISPEQVDLVQYKNIEKLAEKELLANQISLYNIRKQIHLRNGNIFLKATEIQKLILAQLGFELTDDQQKVIEEIELDQRNPIEMMRLLQGDVGSGKTLVALLTIVNVVHEHKFQAVIMAPTDLLANQHYQFFAKALAEVNIRIGLLTGKVTGLARSNTMSDLESGNIDILVGTHALFQEKVNFKNLGYIVIDEQHKFGVQQRLNLIAKASNPDVLVMTATPIPRSLTLTMFGDMSVSKLLHKPKNRLPINTTIIANNKIDQVIEALNKKLLVGERVYWVCPLIEQSDEALSHSPSLRGEACLGRGNLFKELDEIATAPLVPRNDDRTSLMNVVTRFAKVNQVYPDMVGILHGKLKNDQKEEIMQKFKNGEIKILVATTVIEVGIDVPEATLIIIENAEQFGLAQLHQIRGRVGRGCAASHCILLYNPQRLSLVARKRFEVMKSGKDGFYIAEQDLLLRGGGEILGVKQSGEGRFFFADLGRDVDLLIKANKAAESNSQDEIKYIDFQIRLFARTELSELN